MEIADCEFVCSCTIVIVRLHNRHSTENPTNGMPFQPMPMTRGIESRVRHAVLVSHLTHANHHARTITPLSGGSKSVGETTDVVGDLALVAKELDVGTVDPDLALLALLDVLLTTEAGEAPVLGDDDLLATRELQCVSACFIQFMPS